MKRYGSLIGLRPEALDEYKRYHAAVWPEVLAMIQKCNIHNYSIFLKDGLLFSYFEYHGTNYDADMAHMAATICCALAAIAPHQGRRNRAPSSRSPASIGRVPRPLVPIRPNHALRSPCGTITSLSPGRATLRATVR